MEAGYVGRLEVGDGTGLVVCLVREGGGGQGRGVVVMCWSVGSYVMLLSYLNKISKSFNKYNIYIANTFVCTYILLCCVRRLYTIIPPLYSYTAGWNSKKLRESLLFKFCLGYKM
jgi:hypothetical protein